MFNIRPPATFLDSVGNPAVDYLVYVSKPNTDPTDDTQHVRLVDGITGQEVDNPFIVSHKGYAKNANGFVIIPQCAELKVAIRFESPDGGIQWEARQVTSDAFGLAPEDMGTPIADERLNNFEVEALNADLTEYSFVFINSRTANWEDTADGPDYPYFSYKTGSIGSPSTGTYDDFYDANGNQWKITDASKLPLDNADALALNTESVQALIALSGVADGDENLGEFENGIIPDDSTNKEALQVLETNSSPCASGVYSTLGFQDEFTLIEFPVLDVNAKYYVALDLFIELNLQVVTGGSVDVTFDGVSSADGMSYEYEESVLVDIDAKSLSPLSAIIDTPADTTDVQAKITAVISVDADAAAICKIVNNTNPNSGNVTEPGLRNGSNFFYIRTE